MTGGDWYSEFLNRTLSELMGHISADVEQAVSSIMRGLPLESVLAGLGPGFWRALGQLGGLQGFQAPQGDAAYGILGLESSASDAEIKRRYRDLAKRLHPDVAGPETEHLFRLVQAAYEEIARERGWR
jgi:DnaJ-domain-containing protein 1